MNACTTGHLKKNLESNKSASPHANSGGADERPTIPHLKLTYRSSQPYCPPKTPPHVFESSPIKSGTLSGPTRLSSSPSAFVTPIKELPLTKPSPAATHRSPSWSPPGTSLLHSSRVLPLSNELASSFSNQYEKLEIENKALKQEINMMFQGQLGNLKARVYDLEVEVGYHTEFLFIISLGSCIFH
jgi:hypothetical protein